MRKLLALVVLITCVGPAFAQQRTPPILQDPQQLPPVDYLVCESTYGSRCHSTGGNAEELLQKIRCHIKELAYYCPGKTPSNITKLKGIDNGHRLRIEDIRIIFSYDHTNKKLYIHDIGLRKNIYKRLTSTNVAIA